MKGKENDISLPIANKLQEALKELIRRNTDILKLETRLDIYQRQLEESRKLNETLKINIEMRSFNCHCVNQCPVKDLL